MWYAIVISLCLAWWQNGIVSIHFKHCAWHLPLAWLVALFWSLYAAVDVVFHLKDIGHDIYTSLLRPFVFLQRIRIKRKKQMIYKTLIHHPTQMSTQDMALLEQHMPPAEALCALLVHPEIQHIEKTRRLAELWLGKQGLLWLAHNYCRPSTDDHVLLLLRSELFLGSMNPEYLHVLPQFTPERFALCPLPKTDPHASWDPWLIRVCTAHLLVSSDPHSIYTGFSKKLQQHRLIQWAYVESLYGHGLECPHPMTETLERAYHCAYQKILDPNLYTQFQALGIETKLCTTGLHRCHAEADRNNCATELLRRHLYAQIECYARTP